MALYHYDRAPEFDHLILFSEKYEKKNVKELK
jgi:hypothetical protein